MKLNNIAVISLVSTLMVACGGSTSPSAPNAADQAAVVVELTGHFNNGI